MTRRALDSGYWTAALLTALIVGVSASSAGAQSVASGAGAAGREQFRTGMQAWRDHRWADALAALQRAYDALRDPRILVNIAAANVELGRLVAAAEVYDRYLRDSADTPQRTAERTAVLSARAMVQRRIPSLRMRGTDGGGTEEVRVDGLVVDPGPDGRVAVDPGQHVVEVRRDGVARLRRSVGLVEGAIADVDLRDLVGTAAPHAIPADRSRPSALPWVAGASVAAAATIGLVLGISIAVATDAYSGNVPPGRVPIY